MAITVEAVGNNPDGSVQYKIKSDGPLVLTGPIKGQLTLGDGTIYDVSPDAIEVASEDHFYEVMHLIGLHHNEHGHPENGLNPDAPDFYYAAPPDGSIPRPGAN